MAVLNYCFSALLCNPNQTRLMKFMSKFYRFTKPSVRKCDWTYIIQGC